MHVTAHTVLSLALSFIQFLAFSGSLALVCILVFLNFVINNEKSEIKLYFIIMTSLEFFI